MAQQPDWHAEDIKSAIRKSGQTCEGLAVQSGYERSAVRVALRRSWPKVEQIIARHLRLSPWDIWPSRYDANGRPLKWPSGRRRRPLPIAGGQPAHRKTGEAR